MGAYLGDYKKIDKQDVVLAFDNTEEKKQLSRKHSGEMHNDK
ncbi:MAG: hypothetical protein OIN86_17330 [Candidatus Methanoperedens sp.]|nr:hypothetical protein [Candidatus Methanoperedens sp.]